MIICHTEEEQETGKKDSLEEQFIPEISLDLMVSLMADESVPLDKYPGHSTTHIKEIHLPPPERISQI